MSENFFDVTTRARAGHLDQIGSAATRSDLETIRCYLEAEEKVEQIERQDGEKRRAFAIARSVLTAVWESPRMDFDAVERSKGCDLQLSNKALLIPWSAEALDLYRINRHSGGLILEHVLPLDEIWRELCRLHVENEPETWFGEAERFLNYNYTLAVVTKPQADMIDAAGFRKMGYLWDAFARYKAVMVAAAKGPIKTDRENVAFDVARFVHPGFAV
jgi:hypothetical protein